MPPSQRSAPRLPRVAWSWSEAALGAAYALPAAVVALNDVPRGLAFAVGVIPAAATGLQPTRHARRLTIVLGMLAGASLFIGAVLSGVPWIAVVAIFALSVGAALLAARRAAGRVALVLALPLVGIGLSYSDLQEAGGLALVMAAGSLYAFGVSLLWPERAAAPVAPSTAVVRPDLDYGIRLGAAAATAAAIGFLLDVDHVGWACAAALLVMRPSQQMVRLRSVGRVLSVAAGAAVAVTLTATDLSAPWYALAIVAVVAGASATHASRWYVTPGFTSFLVLTLLTYGSHQAAGSRFVERLSETALGVALAYLFGFAVPVARRRYQRRGPVG